MRLLLIATVLAASLAAPVTAEIRPDQVRFRELYKELVETDTRCPREVARWQQSAWRRG